MRSHKGVSGQGEAALEQGLVDSLGGLEDAINKALELADVTENVGRLILPRDGMLWDMFWSGPSLDAEAVAGFLGRPIPGALLESLSQALILASILESEGAMAALPYRMQVQ